MTIFTTFVGVDVSKARLDVSFYPPATPPPLTAHASSKSQTRPPSLHFDNSPDGCFKLHLWMKSLGDSVLTVCESTGGFESELIASFLAADKPIARVNPARAREFANSMGILAKTDAIDAFVLARFAHAKPPEPLRAAHPDVVRVRALMTRRDAVIELRVSETNRLDMTRDDAAIASNVRVVEFLKAEQQLLDDQIAQILRDCPELNTINKRLKTIPGCGDQLARTLIAYLPEIGQSSNRQVTALAGLVPYNRDSGTKVGKRFCQQGRAAVRKCLYMAAMSAIRHNAPIKVFYERLIAKGKPGKVALVACMRKLLCCANAMISHQQDWSADFAKIQLADDPPSTTTA